MLFLARQYNSKLGSFRCHVGLPAAESTGGFEAADLSPSESGTDRVDSVVVQFDVASGPVLVARID